jgi:hypothetical protein
MHRSDKNDDINHFKRALAFLYAGDWQPRVLSAGSLLHTHFEGDNARWEVLVQSREDQGQLIVYSLCPLEIPANRRPAMMEFITRANFGLVTGNFELNLEDGDLRFKTSVDSDGAAITEPVMRSLVYANMAMFDQYFPGVAGVLAGRPVKQCIVECELGMTPNEEERTDGEG